MACGRCPPPTCTAAIAKKKISRYKALAGIRSDGFCSGAKPSSTIFPPVSLDIAFKTAPQAQTHSILDYATTFGCRLSKTFGTDTTANTCVVRNRTSFSAPNVAPAMFDVLRHAPGGVLLATMAVLKVQANVQEQVDLLSEGGRADTKTSVVFLVFIAIGVIAVALAAAGALKAHTH